MTEKKNKFVLKNAMREIKKANIYELEDPREKNYAWNLPDGKQIIIRVREEDSELAGHAHKGRDLSKKPEELFLAKGEMEVMLVNRNFDEEFFVLKEGQSLTINPNIGHKFKAKKTIVLLEYRKNPFDPNNQDIYYFPHYIFP